MISKIQPLKHHQKLQTFSNFDAILTIVLLNISVYYTPPQVLSY